MRHESWRLKKPRFWYLLFRQLVGDLQVEIVYRNWIGGNWRGRDSLSDFGDDFVASKKGKRTFFFGIRKIMDSKVPQMGYGICSFCGEIHSSKLT